MYFALPTLLHCEEHMYINTHTHISDTVQTVYKLPLQHCSETLHTNRERYEVLTGYLSLGRRPGDEWTNKWYRIECFTVFFFFFEESSSSPVTTIFCSLSLISWWSSLDMINVLRINYKILIKICTNNISVISNNYGRLQDLIWLFKNSHEYAKNFIKIYR
jgi:hypothetical protein